MLNKSKETIKANPLSYTHPDYLGSCGLSQILFLPRFISMFFYFTSCFRKVQFISSEGQPACKLFIYSFSFLWTRLELVRYNPFQRIKLKRTDFIYPGFSLLSQTRQETIQKSELLKGLSHYPGVAKYFVLFPFPSPNFPPNPS